VINTNTFIYDPLTGEEDSLEKNAEIVFVLRQNKYLRVNVENGRLRIYSPNGTIYISAEMPGLVHVEIGMY